ncbi:MAG TPA: PAS domain S-box protein, partial [Oculatellaceae cyanobacterium]
MKKWAHHAPMNHLHKFYLVEAERYRVQSNYVKAMEYYDAAISGAVENEYIQEEALANELAAKFYLSLGRSKIAKTYLIDAQDGYQRWGATAKVKNLVSKYPQWFKSGSESAKTDSIEIKTSTASSLTGKGGSSALDLATVMKAAQAISSEMVLDKLLAKLMKILLENAGAQKGIFILEQDNQRVIEASIAIEQDEVAVRQSIPVETSGLLPVSVVNYVARSLEDVVLSDAAHDGRFTTDPYIIQHQPLSILCTPIRGQGQLIGILYLENNLTNSAFTPDRLEVLRMLCCQAAIALQNAQAHEQLEEYSRTLEQKIEERTQELQQEIRLNEASQKACMKAEEALRLTQFAVDRSVDAITWIASDSRFVYVNDAACNLMDYTREELVTSSVCDLLKAAAQRSRNPDFCPERWPKHWQELKQRGSLVFETRLKAKNGKLIPIEVSSNYVEVDGQGYICAFSRDITARKQAERALRRSEVKFRNLFENSQVGIFRTRISDGLILDANQRYIEMTGYSCAADVIGQKYSPEFYVNLDDRQRMLAQLQQYGQVNNFEMQYRQPNGSMHWGLFSVRLNAEEGCLEGVITDISDRKQTEEALQRSELKFRNIFENSLIGIFRCRLSDGLVLEVNQRGVELM